MKVTDSGMPDREYWESLFDIPNILEEMLINEKVYDLAEFGCGYGTFTIPTALRIYGVLNAYDIDESYLEIARLRMKTTNLKNVIFHNRDFIKNGTGLTNNSVSYVMLFNILHHTHPSDLILESKRILSKAGIIGVIHWRSDIPTPRGPNLEIRPKPGDLIEAFRSLGLECIGEKTLNPYHYGLLFNKIE